MAPRSSFSSRLNESDTILWNIERDPALRTTIVALAVLDRPPDLERLRAKLVDTAELVPRLHQRVVEPPFRIGPPRWVDDERFDLDYHLRVIRAPEPGDWRTVLDLIAPIAMAAFDKDRPLWEFTVVEGLEDGRCAFVQKVHHAFTDGVGGMAIARLLLDDDRDGPSTAGSKKRAGRTTPAHSAGTDVLFDNIADEARRTAATTARLGMQLPGVAIDAAQHPVRAVDVATRTLKSAGKLVAPVREPLSPIMRGRGLSRHLDAFDVPLDDMSAAAHAVDGTLNDAFLASIAGGMRRYHERHGATATSLRVTMPVNLRREGDDLGNNRFTPVRFALPVDCPDPAERMRQIGEIARRWRREPALPLTEVIAGTLNRLPVAATTSVFGAMLKSIDFVATNVPGLAGSTYLAGAEVLREYAFAPPSGAAFSIALLSHRGECCIGINSDGTAVPDASAMGEDLRAGFAEVVAVGRP